MVFLIIDEQLPGFRHRRLDGGDLPRRHAFVEESLLDLGNRSVSDVHGGIVL